MSTLELENIKHPDNSGNNIALNSNGSMVVDRQSTDGTITEFRRSGTTVGSIGTNGSTLYIGSTEGADAHIGFGNQIIRPVTASGASRDNAIDLGYNGMRFRDLYLSGGVYLGGTGSTNKLDDYEEGTWTPTDISGAGITGFNISHNQYTKIGRKVFAHCQITFPSSSNTTMVRLSLPFNTDTNSTNSATGGVCQEQNIGSGQTVIAAVNYTNAVIFRPNGYGNYNFSQLSSKTLRFAIHYNTA